jgi:hypothetical protein
LIRYCKTTRDNLCPSVWGPVQKGEDPYAAQGGGGGCCSIQVSNTTRTQSYLCSMLTVRCCRCSNLEWAYSAVSLSCLCFVAASILLPAYPTFHLSPHPQPSYYINTIFGHSPPYTHLPLPARPPKPGSRRHRTVARSPPPPASAFVGRFSLQAARRWHPA